MYVYVSVSGYMGRGEEVVSKCQTSTGRRKKGEEKEEEEEEEEATYVASRTITPMQQRFLNPPPTNFLPKVERGVPKTWH